MANEQGAHDDLNALEAALAGLTPRAGRLDRDRLMFLAGQAAASVSPAGSVSAAAVLDGPSSSGRRGWQAAFAGMSAIAAGLLIAILLRPPQVVERIVERPTAPPKTEFPETAPWHDDHSQSAVGSNDGINSYMRLRDLVCLHGLDAWPLSAAAAGVDNVHGPLRPASLGPLLDELFEQPGAPGAVHPALSPESVSHPGEKS